MRAMAMGLVAAGLAVSAMAAQKPNVVVIVADDLGYADVGFHGCKDIPTPHLDKLAASGTRFTSGYVSHSFCSPTRAGLMTGRYQQRFGHETNPAFLPDDTTVGLPVGEITIADLMQKAGYATGFVGKWHLGAAAPFHPLDRGFQEMYGFLGGGHQYFPEMLTGTAEYTVPLMRNRETVKETEYLTTAFGREAAAFIGRHKEHPFFLYLAFNAPHTPLQAPGEAIAKLAGIADEKRRVYGAMIAVMDDAIGRTLAALREAGVEKNTLVFFLSDNGGPTSVTNCRNDPLKGAKGQTYEGGIRVPFLASWPGRLPAGVTYDLPVVSLDILPTAVALAGGELPKDRPIDGVNLMPFLLGEAKGAPHAILFWRQNGGMPWAVRSGDDKLVMVQNGTAVEHYNLANDIGEATNLGDAGSDAVKAAIAKFEAWNAHLVAPKWQSPRAGKKKGPADAEKKAGPKGKAAEAKRE
jgi:arylsulfatase A-like enzyme